MKKKLFEKTMESGRTVAVPGFNLVHDPIQAPGTQVMMSDGVQKSNDPPSPHPSPRHDDPVVC